ncbi:probable RNA-directed DNA polymerase from transposon X-element [Trichonephila clavipes]|nr:probable RNA-directed DNA polymerase from transposon X-element [Trichonephila clavipes]
MISKSPIGLSLCSWNANGLLSKLTELKIFIEQHSPDLILIQETHLRPSHNINIANYTCYRNDRPTSSDNNRAFGGTLILVKNAINHYSLPTPPMQTIEATIVILTPFDHDPISIVSVYIPPNSDEYTFTIDIENLIQTSSNCVLFGDFNAPHTAWNCNTNSSRGVRLLDFTNLANLYIAYPDTPTRFGLNSANTLDIAIIRNFYYPYTINSLHELSSDHNPVMLNFTLKLNKDVTNPRAVHTNWPLFSNYLNTKLSLFNYHPNSINSNSDIDQKISEFTDTVRAAHSHASRPIETLRKSFTPHHIHKLIKQKNQFRNLYHRTLDPHYKTLYNRAQKNVKKELKNYTNENWTARLQALSTQDNSLWAVQKFSRTNVRTFHHYTALQARLLQTSRKLISWPNQSSKILLKTRGKITILMKKTKLLIILSRHSFRTLHPPLLKRLIPLRLFPTLKVLMLKSTRTFPQRLARPISIQLHASMITLWSDLHKHTGYGMEARFASHMPRNCTEGTEENHYYFDIKRIIDSDTDYRG